MDQQVSLLTLIIAVATSFLGSLAFFWYIRGREKRIKAKIAELQYEEEFLDKIKKGNIELIRSSFRAISFSLFLVFSSGSFLLSIKLIPFPDLLITNIVFFSVAMWAAAAATCLHHFRSLVRLNNVNEAKEKLSEKRRKLQEKL